MKCTLKSVLPRLFVGTVLFVNVQCAMLFLLFPDRFVPGFELAGIPGRAVIQGMGLLFLMWNVPYGFACMNPVRHRSALFQTILMQTIGLVGEMILWLSLPDGHPVLEGTVIRFILFDAPGLVLLGAAYRMISASGLG